MFLKCHSYFDANFKKIRIKLFINKITRNEHTFSGNKAMYKKTGYYGKVL